jgi:hypothetical protein
MVTAEQVTAVVQVQRPDRTDPGGRHPAAAEGESSSTRNSFLAPPTHRWTLPSISFPLPLDSFQLLKLNAGSGRQDQPSRVPFPPPSLPPLPLVPRLLYLLGFACFWFNFHTIHSFLGFLWWRPQVKSLPPSAPRQSKQAKVVRCHQSKQAPHFPYSYTTTSSCSSIHRMAMSSDTAATTGTCTKPNPNHRLPLSIA